MMIGNNLGLKAISLALAVATWFYVEWTLAKIKKEKETAITSMLQYEVISKRLPVELTIAGTVAGDYEIIKEGISINPPSIVVVGPKALLEDIDTLKTVPIDISEFTKEVKRAIFLAPMSNGLVLKELSVDVTVPIRKKEQPQQPQQAQ